MDLNRDQSTNNSSIYLFNVKFRFIQILANEKVIIVTNNAAQIIAQQQKMCKYLYNAVVQ